jgi:hypothetical protein
LSSEPLRLTNDYATGREHGGMAEGPNPLALPVLPAAISRPSRAIAPANRRLRRAVWVGIGLLHVLLVVLLDRAMQFDAGPSRTFVADDAVTIRWIEDPPPAVPIEPPAVEETTPRPVTVAPRAPVAAPAPEMTATAAPDGSTTAPVAEIDTTRLFNPDGSVRMSTSVIEAARTPERRAGFQPPQTVGLAPIRSPIPYKPSRLDPVWVPDGENLTSELFRKATVAKEVKTPWGTRWRCVWVLVIAGCGGLPPPAAKNPPPAPWETYLPHPNPRPDSEDEF